MRRRDFIILLGSAAALSWPLAATAQWGEGRRLMGVLMGFAEGDLGAQSMAAAFRKALSELRWTEGSNVRIEFRWSGGYEADRIKTLAKELVDLQPDAILAQSTPV